MANHVVALQSERGYSATKYDGSEGKPQKPLRRQFEQKYDVKKVRNTNPQPLSITILLLTDPFTTATRTPNIAHNTPSLFRMRGYCEQLHTAVNHRTPPPAPPGRAGSGLATQTDLRAEE